MIKFFLPDEYQPRATAIFEQIRGELSLRLPYVKIEHIGSSAIPGAFSKGDLDIFVGVTKNKFIDVLKELEVQGFSIKNDTYRTESLCMLETSKYNFDVAIQLVELGSEFENFLKFRDLLISQPKLLEGYNKLKNQSKEMTAEDYRVKKSKFISEVLNTAGNTVPEK